MHTHSTIDAATACAPSEQSVDDIDAAICALAQQMNAETYRMLVLVREFDDRFGWAKWSSRNCAEWLAWRCGMMLSTAREKVRTAHALRERPAISAAFAEGRLSYSKVRALTRVALTHDEDSLLAYALQADAPHVEERCRQIRNGTPESAGGAWRAWERRSLTLWRDQARGMMSIRVEVPIEEGEAIAKALERASAAGAGAMGPEFAATGSSPPEVRDSADATASSTGNGWRAQQADALVVMAKAYLTGGEQTVTSPADATTSAADLYQVVVHVDESALHGRAGRADLPIDTVKRLTCDGSVIKIIEDEHGTPLDVGRKQRTVSTPLKRALWARDRGCTFPGCSNTRFVDAHHIRHWADGGDTSIGNLTLLCSHHHRLLHEGGFKIRRYHDGAIYFQRADGRAIPRFGYRLGDFRDEYAPLVETAAPENPSVEVRESAAIYLVGRAAVA